MIVHINCVGKNSTLNFLVLVTNEKTFPLLFTSRSTDYLFIIYYNSFWRYGQVCQRKSKHNLQL